HPGLQVAKLPTSLNHRSQMKIAPGPGLCRFSSFGRARLPTSPDPVAADVRRRKPWVHLVTSVATESRLARALAPPVERWRNIRQHRLKKRLLRNNRAVHSTLRTPRSAFRSCSPQPAIGTAPGQPSRTAPTRFTSDWRNSTPG